MIIPINKLPASTDLKFRLTAVTSFEGDDFKSDPVVVVPVDCSTPAGGKWIFLVNY